MVLGLGGFVANLKANVRGFQVETHERVRWFSTNGCFNQS
jgi:hypothetical protein